MHWQSFDFALFYFLFYTIKSSFVALKNLDVNILCDFRQERSKELKKYYNYNNYNILKNWKR